MLAAVTVHGPLAADSVKASANSGLFSAFVDHALVPARGQVVVMENFAVNKVRGVAEAVERAGRQVVYLPPYSPDLSPIEPAFDKFKQHLSCLRTYVLEKIKADLKAFQYALK